MQFYLSVKFTEYEVVYLPKRNLMTVMTFCLERVFRFNFVSSGTHFIVTILNDFKKSLKHFLVQLTFATWSLKLHRAEWLKKRTDITYFVTTNLW